MAQASRPTFPIVSKSTTIGGGGRSLEGIARLLFRGILAPAWISCQRLTTHFGADSY
jgi:hypothetical protein